MKKVLFYWLCLFVICGSAYAAPVPELLPPDSPLIPPPIKAKFPVYHPIKVEPPPAPSEKEILDSIKNLSGAAYLSVMKRILDTEQDGNWNRPLFGGP